MALLHRDRLAETGEVPSSAEHVQYWFACGFVLVWSGVLCGGLVLQLTTGELPRPLYLVQRMFMVLAMLGAAYIVRRGLAGVITRRDYLMGWGMALVACAAGALTSWRQTAERAVPGADGYDTVLLGLRGDAWPWLLFQGSVLAIGLVMAFSHRTAARQVPQWGVTYRVGWLVLVLAAAAIVAQAVGGFLLEGFHLTLPEEPTGYRLFDDLGLFPSG